MPWARGSISRRAGASHRYAGLRETVDVIEAEGMKRARARAAKADFLLLVAAPGEAFPDYRPGAAALRLRTKSDLTPAEGICRFGQNRARHGHAAGQTGRNSGKELTDRQGCGCTVPPTSNGLRARHRGWLLDTALARG